MYGIPLRHIAFLIVATLPLCACAPGAKAITESLRFVKSGSGDKQDMLLAPGMRYLRVQSGGGVAIMALGYVETGASGETEIWYSAIGEVLKICNGRIVGSAGLDHDWREVRLPTLPRWSAVGTAAISYERERDEMPGYRLNLMDTVFVRAIAPPADTALIGIDAQNLTWYEERAIPDKSGGIALPTARFGVTAAADRDTVTYAEQCLAATLCLSWQRWPPPAGTRE